VFILTFNTYLESGFTYVYLAGLITFWLGIFFLYNKEKKEYLLYFSYFWIFASAATAADILYFHFENNLFLLLHSVMHLLEAFYLIKAVHKYFNQKAAAIWSKFLKIIFLLSVLGFFFSNQLFMLAPTLVYLSFAFIKSARLFIGLSFNEISIFTGVASLLFGLNKKSG